MPVLNLTFERLRKFTAGKLRGQTAGTIRTFVFQRLPKLATDGLGTIALIVRAFRIPIAAAAVVGCVLSLPQQIIEIYRALAQELLFNTSQFVPTLTLASSVVLFAACVASIWITARSIDGLGITRLRTGRLPPARAELARRVSAYMPEFLAVVPVVGLATGVFRSVSESTARHADQALQRTVSEVFGENEEAVVASIMKRMLGYNHYLEYAAIAISMAAVLVVVVPVLVRFWPAMMRRWPSLARLSRALARLWPTVLRRRFASEPAARPRTELFNHPVRCTCYGVALALVIIAVLSRVTVPQIIGTLGILFAFVAIVTPILAHFATLSDRHGAPYLVVAIVIVAAMSALDCNDSHTLYRTAAPPPASAAAVPGTATAQAPGLAAPADGPCPALNDDRLPPVEDAFCHWWQKRSDKDRYGAGRRYPVYVVAAEGGGIYAALHAASVLGGLQDRCPAFAEHLFAISSVSGGSLGAATFAAGLKYAQQAGWPSAKNVPCRPFERDGEVDASPPQDRERSMVEFADALLTRDLFSPLAAGLMFPDMLQGLLPFALDPLDRTHNFEAAFESALDDTIAEMEVGDGYRGAVENFFRVPVLKHWMPSARTPALVMNTTEVGSGRVRLIAPFVLDLSPLLFLPLHDAALTAKVGRSLEDLPISTAAITSARFPWVTPAGAFSDWSSPPPTGAERQTAKIRLVDGGYFENSGVATAMELISGMRRAASQYDFADKVRFRLIILTKGGYERQEFFGLSELISPFVTLLSTRSSRAPLIIDQVESRLLIDGLEREHLVRDQDRKIIDELKRRQVIDGAEHAHLVEELERAFRDSKAGSELVPKVESDLVVSKVRLEDLYYRLPLGWRLSTVSSILIQTQNGMPDRCANEEGGTQSFDADCMVNDVMEELH